MRRRSFLTPLLVASCVLATAAVRESPALAAPVYVSPLPGSERVLPETNLIVRPGGRIDPFSIAHAGEGVTIAVSGSRSGPRAGTIVISDDGETLVFRPDAPFVPGETVAWRIGPGLVTDTAGEVSPAEHVFHVAGPERETLRSFVPPDAWDAQEDLGGGDAGAPRPALGAAGGDGAAARVSSLDSLPDDFPKITASLLGKVTHGRVFLTSINLSNADAPSYLLILNNDGSPYWYRRTPSRALDFKMQPNGLLTYFDRASLCYYALDSTFAVVDSFRCGNGYTTDGHDLVILPNGHALVMAYDPQIMDMSLIVPKGNPNAIVIGLIVQELDRQKNVVFQWRSWDHFQITDIIGHPLTGSTVDYVHGNSVEADPAGDIVISSRHLDEVTKISRQTGQILWRLGGKNNQFLFENDPIGFSHQHAARWIAPGRLTLFDNGFMHEPRFSRAVEYRLDEANRIATLVWQHRLQPDVYGAATGYVQRLPSGNTLIQWGTTRPTMTEVTSDGRLVHELSLEQGVFAYRAFRFEWPRVHSASVALSPSTFTGGGGKGFVNARIEGIDFDVAAIDVSTVTLDERVPAMPQAATVGDANGNGIRDLTVSFDRTAAAALVDATTTWLSVEGSLTTGGRFRGYGAVKVTQSFDMSGGGGSMQVTSAPGALPVVVALRGDAAAGSEGAERTVSIHDVHGRLVRSWKAPVGPGARIAWDGRRADGAAAASGIYFMRLEPGRPGGPEPARSGRSPTLKIVLVR